MILFQDAFFLRNSFEMCLCFLANINVRMQIISSFTINFTKCERFELFRLELLYFSVVCYFMFSFSRGCFKNKVKLSMIGTGCCSESRNSLSVTQLLFRFLIRGIQVLLGIKDHGVCLKTYILMTFLNITLNTVQ